MKKQNKKYIILLIFMFFTYSLFSFINKKNVIDQKLEVCLKNKNFISAFNICKKKGDTIYIFNNTDIEIKTKIFKIDCNKILFLNNSKIVYNVNVSANENQKQLIILYGFKAYKNKVEFYFLETISNWTTTMVFNNNNKLISCRTGIF